MFDKKILDSIHGQFSPAQANLMYRRAAKVTNGQFVELGTLCGKATYVLSVAAKELKYKPWVITLDTHNLDFVRMKYGRTNTFVEFMNNMQLAKMSNVLPIVGKISDAYINLMRKDKYIGFLFLDASKEYADVKRDFGQFEPHLLGDATVVFHDYDWKTIKKFVDELLADSWKSLEIGKNIIAIKRI